MFRVGGASNRGGGGWWAITVVTNDSPHFPPIRIMKFRLWFPKISQFKIIFEKKLTLRRGDLNKKWRPHGWDEN